MIFEKIQLEDNEHVVRIVRKHWILLLKDLFGVSLILFTPLFFILFFNFVKNFITLPNISDYYPIFTFLSALWILICWMMLAYGWTNYYLDLWVITNRRIILIDQRGFFSRLTSSFRLERLQDINVEVNGMIATFLDYGTIEAQTAGSSHETFLSHYMPRPQEIKAQIIHFADKITAETPELEKKLTEQGL